MVTFADTYTPRELRVKRAVGEMRDRLGPRPPTPALYRELAGDTDELGQAWIRAGLS
jgi:hypothetical protein